MDLLVVEVTVGTVLAYAAWDLVKDWKPSWTRPARDPVVALDRAPSAAAILRITRIAAVPTFVSARYRLRGRPDELRGAPDGRLVPVEIKSAASPRGGPQASHRMQLLAYCLLVEEETQRPPPYGILCYGDGREFRVAWDGAARAEVLAGLVRLGGLYMGQADPAPWKCTPCRFGTICPGAAVVHPV